MTRPVSRRSLRSRWLPLAAMVMGLTVLSLAAPGAARADHDDWGHRWSHHDRDDWRWHRPFGGYGWVGPRAYAGWYAPAFVAPPPYYAVPAVPPYVVAPPPPPVVVVPALPRIVLPLGHHGAVIFGP